MWHFRCKQCPSRVLEDCQSCEVQRFVRDCQAAVDLIGWYLDSYHQANFGHREMISQLDAILAAVQRSGQIREADRAALRDIEQRVDHWLYQTI